MQARNGGGSISATMAKKRQRRKRGGMWYVPPVTGWHVTCVEQH